MTAKEKFRKNLRFLRKQFKYTTPYIAQCFGVSRARYASWEYTSCPDYDMLVQIADFYDVGIDNLLTCDLSTVES